ncbi:hypothetical protein [Fundidesulfovibrio agrisoli]|uniref:hypothetical protein n=1 Tax=Fundidesulfovibrio agrisoli TaxID=2922717 RepID=UPI001FAD6644|nr:hypothetical protein [Fundidesulfovibrio agrisoli]
MAPNGKINIIWFRDQEPARRLRLRVGWIRAFTYLLVLLLLIAAGGLFGAAEFWRRTQEVQTAKRDVEKRLSETLLKLERLQNIEKLLQTSDPTELAQLLAGLGIENAAARTQPAQPAQQAAKTGKDQGKNATAPAPAPEKPAGFDLADIMGRVDLGQVAVENFRAKADAKGVQAGFDLSNLMPQPQAGGGQLLAISREGAVFPVQPGKDELTFNIQRFKQVSVQAPLPQGLDPAQVFGFRLVLANGTGKTIFSETYPLAQTQ